MRGLMQDRPLLLSNIFNFAAQYHGEQKIYTRSLEGPIHQTNYAELVGRARQLANALQRLGVQMGDRVGTLAWNTYRHLEVWYGLVGIGAVAHTINPRLFAEQISYIINHAENNYIFLDPEFVPLLEGLKDEIPTVKGFIVMTGADYMPETSLTNVMCYEDLLAAETDEFDWPEFDENTAAGMCYTSGTTGNPKGVLYSHRSTYLQAMAECFVDTIGASATSTVLPVVPMYHANAWGIPYVAPMVGSAIVMPGNKMDAPSIYELCDKFKISHSAAVPTVWLSLLTHMQQNNLGLEHMERVVIGGSAVPRSMMEAFEKDFGVTVCHAWGMTELNPLGSVGAIKAAIADLPFEEQLEYKLKQGRGICGVDFKITDDDGNVLPHDGASSGHLMCRGPWVVKEYFKSEGGEILDAEGYFDTGDIANIDELGFIQLTDRAKDVIKSGGEWISSIDLENEAVGNPEIAEAGVIGLYHPKWDERPLLVCVPAEGANPTKETVLAYLDGRIAKWWMPDDVVFVDELPHTATGKILKTALRDQFKDHRLPTY